MNNDWYWINGSAYCPECVECDTPAIDSGDATRGSPGSAACACCGKRGGRPVSECISLPLTSAAYLAVRDLDYGWIGTPDYIGLAYFWNVEYKHQLRAATPKLRKAVHDDFIATGLPIDGESLDHAEIVRRHTAKRCKKVYG